MNKTKFLGARIEPEVFEIVDKVAKQRHVDRTAAIKILVIVGWKGLSLEQALEKYRKGLISIDKAAKIAEIPVCEMMQEAAARGIKSEETIEEYRKGIKLLTSS